MKKYKKLTSTQPCSMIEINMLYEKFLMAKKINQMVFLQ